MAHLDEREREIKATRKPTRGRFKNPKTRYWVYQFLAQRDGHKCVICGASDDEVELVIHHKDGNPENNDPRNLCFLCRSDNEKEVWRIRQSKPSSNRDVITLPLLNVRERDSERAGLDDVDAKRSMNIVAGQGESMSAEIKINKEKEPTFRGWIMEYLLTNGSMDVATAINGGAEKFSVSPLTTRRYLNKMVSEEGSLRISNRGKGFTNILQIKPEWWDKLSAEVPLKKRED